MKTKLDELLSNYLKKDKRACNTLVKIDISENKYKASLPAHVELISDKNKFKSRALKVWNLMQGKEKSAPAKKEEIIFPDFLEFALKTNVKPRNKNEIAEKSTEEKNISPQIRQSVKIKIPHKKGRRIKEISPPQDFEQLRDSLSDIRQQLEQLSEEIANIWKTIAKISIS